MNTKVPLTRYGRSVTGQILRSSHHHGMVVLQFQSGRLFFQDSCVADALLWRRVASGASFHASRLLPGLISPNVKLQQAACAAALFQAPLVIYV